jgi:aminoglycoside phosphotransferase
MNRPGLLAFDPAVPRRDSLLDEQHIGPRLAVLGHGPPDAQWRVAKVKYNIGRDLRVVYRRADDEGDRLIAVRTVPRSGDARFSRFPTDRRLGWLPALMAPRDAFASLLDGAWTSSRLAGYAPEKSAVVACVDAARQPIAYAKLFAHAAEAGGAFEVTRRIELASRAAKIVLRTPRPILLAEAQNLLITEAARGRRLTELSGAELEWSVGLMGRALAELHAMRVPLDAVVHDRTGDAALNDAAGVIGRARPDLADVAAHLAQSLLVSRPTYTRRVPLHGDVHLKNVLLDRERIWLIDFDQAHAGPAAADLGSFLAVLRSDALVGARTAAESVELADAFLRGYALVRPLPPLAELRWHTSAALLAERALRAVTRVRRDILAHLPALIADAGRSRERGVA